MRNSLSTEHSEYNVMVNYGVKSSVIYLLSCDLVTVFSEMVDHVVLSWVHSEHDAGTAVSPVKTWNTKRFHLVHCASAIKTPALLAVITIT